MATEGYPKSNPLTLLTMLVLLPPLLMGCAAKMLPGAVFTWVTVPLTTNLNQTPTVVSKDYNGRMIQVKEPFSGYGFYAEIDSNGIGDIARKHHLRTVYFADKEIFNILGVWKTETVTVYGE
ncbi:MAG: hypothetical protein ACOZF0_03525 [Thermodesulfobacteriota bacterium]